MIIAVTDNTIARAYLDREKMIQDAAEKYPDLEIGEAYRKYAEEQGIEAQSLNTNSKLVQRAKALVKQSLHMPCKQPGCDGTMVLESVCGGCVEGRKGYKSKWTCEKCLHRELSTKEMVEWLPAL